MLEKSNSYLMQTNATNDVLNILEGKQGLLVTRETPKNISLKKVNTIWVTNIKTKEKHLEPRNLEQLSYDIDNYMKDHPGSLVVVSGIEYLISYTSFNKIFHMIHNLKDLAYLTKTVLIVCIGANTMNKNEESLLKQELLAIGEPDA